MMQSPKPNAKHEISGQQARGGSPITGRVFMVLVASMTLAVIAGVGLYLYFY